MRNKYKGLRELLEKWKRLDKSVITVPLVVVIMFVLSWLVFSAHLNDIAAKYRELISEEVESQVENSCLKIEQTIVKRCEIVTNISKGLADRQNIDEEYIRTTFAYALNSADFVELIYADSILKNIYTSSGTEFTGNLTNYVNAYDGFSDYCIFDNYDHICTDESSFVIVAPVKKSYRTYGYVFAVAEYSIIEEYSEIRYDVEGDIAIIDDTGKVVTSIMDNKVEKINNNIFFFDEVSRAVTPDDFNELISVYDECIRNNSTTSYMAETDGRNVLFIFHSLRGSGRWAVVYCLEEESIISIVHSMLVSSVIMFVVIILLMVIAALTVIHQMRKEQIKVANLEYLDGLTGIMNRNAFTSKAEEILKENKNLPYYIVCMDIVNFRIINETYGHERSDIVIKALADGCKEAFGKNEIYGRLNADVFVALVINDGEGEERTEFLEAKVRDAAKTVYINHPIKLKKGYYEIEDYTESVARMIDKSNIARKYINSDSKDLTCFYSDELMEGARKIELIESKMETALINGEFKPYLQAKFDMEQNHVCGAEALVRWQKADGTLIPPADFIPLFEKNGFIEKVDFFILEEICKYLRKMIDENREVYPVSVNQSRYLLNDPDYVSKVREILLRYKIPIGLIELELTETVFMHERERMISMMNELKYIHVNLSIDDFGSGYSSFNLLKDVPFDVLKIDREFLSDSTHSERSKWILTEIVEMAHGLGMNVICEGVETREQSEMLLSIGCMRAQGFLYARPIPLQDFVDKFNLKK